MSILIAGHFIYTGRVGGSEHMVYNLTRGLSDLGVDVTFLCADRKNLSPEFLEDSRITHRAIIECGGKGSRFISEQRACLDHRLHGTAILFPQYYLPPVVPKRLGHAAVVIHDFQYRHFPQYFSAMKRAWLRLCHWRAFATSTKVIVVSDFVRSGRDPPLRPVRRESDRHPESHLMGSVPQNAWPSSFQRSPLRVVGGCALST